MTNEAKVLIVFLAFLLLMFWVHLFGIPSHDFIQLYDFDWTTDILKVRPI